MHALHQKLHLQHRQHTGKLLHHRHTSYRSLAVVLVLAGMCMLGMNYVQHTAADELFSVSASVHVPAPHSAPIISRPAANQTLTNGYAIVTGGCPLVSPQAVIAISVDGTIAGTAACNGSNDFSFAASLSTGVHTITAIPYTLDHDHGPASTPLQVTVQNGAASPAKGIALTGNSLFSTVTSDKTVAWHGTVTGPGNSYHLLLEWGDGTYDAYTVRPGPVTVHHQYAQAAAYNITLGLRSGSGTYSYLQTAAVSGDNSGVLGAALVRAQPQPAVNTSSVIGLYGLFITLVALCGIVRLHAAPFAYTNITLSHHGHA